jgi:hypothetical protein
MGDLIVTWVRSSSVTLTLCVWTLTGAKVAVLQTEAPLVQVDVARVTWVSVRTLDHFILAALDARSIVSLWDSQLGFAPIFRFHCGCEEPFDLVLTQDFLAVVNDSVTENRLELRFLKLWLHPSFEPEGSAEDAARLRAETVKPGGVAAGSSFAQTSGAHATAEHLQRSMLKELRHSVVPIKRFSIPDLDSYFASYRNFLNVCSFHKSGQESLSVYRSSSLQKKIFFPPAKHTKFEEWLALQVHNDGTVVLHDFRPGLVAFDEIDAEVGVPGVGQYGDASSREEDAEAKGRRGDGPRSRLVSGRSRGR